MQTIPVQNKRQVLWDTEITADLQGKSVRMHIFMKDCDFYSFLFRD